MPKHNSILKHDFFNLLKTDNYLFSFLLEKQVSGFCYWRLKPDDEIWLSANFWKMTGYDSPADDMSERILNTKDFLSIKSFFNNNTDNNTSYEGTFSLIHRDGHKTLNKIIARAIQCEANEINGIAIAFIRKMDNANLKSSESDFLGNVSHELRTPLNGVIGFTDLLLKSELSPQQRKFTDTIYHSADKLEALINDMLEYADLSANKIKLEPTPTKLYELCHEITEFIDQFYNNKNNRVYFNHTIDPDNKVLADPHKLRQVLLNLLNNAAKFTNNGKITLQVDKIADNSNTCTFQFSIKDSGSGIARKNLKKITKAFDQEDSSLTRPHEGMGLGLAITDSLLKLMNSSLSIESTPGKGSSFSFQISFKKVKKAADSSSKIIEKQADIVFSTNNNSEFPYKILIAEDNPINQFLIQTIIEKIFPQAKLVICENGIEAVKNFKQERFDIIILDIQMPFMSGYEAAVEIRKLEKSKRIPIIALTARTLEKEKELCFESGMDEYLTKPVIYETLKKVLYSHLNRNHQQGKQTTKKIYGLTYLNELSEGDNFIIKDSLGMFISWVGEKIMEAREVLNEKKFEDLKNIAHNIKPSFEMIENLTGSELCNDIVYNATEDMFPDLFAQLNQEYNTLKETILTDYPNLIDYEKENISN